MTKPFRSNAHGGTTEPFKPAAVAYRTQDVALSEKNEGSGDHAAYDPFALLFKILIPLFLVPY